MFWIAWVKICRASLGAALPRFWINDWVTEWPSNPSSETTTISIGKIASTP